MFSINKSNNFFWRIYTFTNAMTCFNIRNWVVELNLTKNLNFFFFQVFVTYVIWYSCNLLVVLLPYCSKWFPLISSDMTLFSRLFTFMRKRWFSTWWHFMVASFKLSTASSNPSKRDNVFSSRLILRSILATNELHQEIFLIAVGLYYITIEIITSRQLFRSYS